MQYPNRHHYLIYFRYLGFRYHGWQKQLNAKTVQYMMERTLTYILGDEKFKILACSRTDSMVSAQKSALKLTVMEPKELAFLKEELNKCLPADIEILDVEHSTPEFQIIGNAKLKTYHYFFSNDVKAHPFSAPFMGNFKEPLDINLMKLGAKLFEGTHDFKLYCFKGTEKTISIREVVSSEVCENDIMTASFFPKKSYVFKIKGPGFMRNQIRIMMGALFNLGAGKTTLEDIKKSLTAADMMSPGFIAPASGLILSDLEIKKD